MSLVSYRLLHPRGLGTARLELALSAPKAEVLPFTPRPWSPPPVGVNRLNSGGRPGQDSPLPRARKTSRTAPVASVEVLGTRETEKPPHRPLHPRPGRQRHPGGQPGRRGAHLRGGGDPGERQRRMGGPPDGARRPLGTGGGFGARGITGTRAGPHGKRPPPGGWSQPQKTPAKKRAHPTRWAQPSAGEKTNPSRAPGWVTRSETGSAGPTSGVVGSGGVVPCPAQTVSSAPGGSSPGGKRRTGGGEPPGLTPPPKGVPRGERFAPAARPPSGKGRLVPRTSAPPRWPARAGGGGPKC